MSHCLSIIVISNIHSQNVSFVMNQLYVFIVFMGRCLYHIQASPVVARKWCVETRVLI